MAEKEITVAMKFLSPPGVQITDEEIAGILFKMESNFNREVSPYRLHILDYKSAVPEVKKRAPRSKKDTVPFAGVEVPVTPTPKASTAKKVASPSTANGAQSMYKDEL